VLFIADEVQSGFGRTGALFACQRYGIEPDFIVTCEISRRRFWPLPLSRARRDMVLQAGRLGGKFAGNPLGAEIVGHWQADHLLLKLHRRLLQSAIAASGFPATFPQAPGLEHP